MNAETEILALPKDMGTIEAAQTSPKPGDEHVFGQIPKLRHLLPIHHGIPGFHYLQCSKDNIWRAENDGWERVNNSVMYVISGPKGDAYMVLYTRGRRIPGQPISSGRQIELLDNAVYEITGFKNPNSNKDEVKVTNKAKEKTSGSS